MSSLVGRVSSKLGRLIIYVSQIVFIIRFSAIPSHFSTAVFSTGNVNFWYFVIATFLTLPKQLVLVYLGVLFGQEADGNVEKNVMLGITFVITLVLAIYIWYKMRNIKATLLEEQTRRREEMEKIRQRSPSGQGSTPEDWPLRLDGGLQHT